jgi:ketosteroid isomerase-like protein
MGSAPVIGPKRGWGEWPLYGQRARPRTTQRKSRSQRSVAVGRCREYSSAMSEANIAVVRGMWEAFLRNDAEAANAAFDPDVEWDGTNLPDGEISRGLDAAVAHVRRWAQGWETWEVELEDVIDAGEDRVIAFVRERGRSKAGLDTSERHSELYVVRGGRIVYRKGFSDADQALVEVGLDRPARP